MEMINSVKGGEGYGGSGGGRGSAGECDGCFGHKIPTIRLGLQIGFLHIRPSTAIKLNKSSSASSKTRVNSNERRGGPNTSVSRSPGVRLVTVISGNVKVA